MRLGKAAATAAVLLASACGVNVETEDGNKASAEPAAEDQRADAGPADHPAVRLDDPAAVKRALDLAARSGPENERSLARASARSEMNGLRIVVDQSDRKVRIYRGDSLVRTHDVAVGTDKNPTPIGDFAFHRVDLNPRWVPPDSEWAEDREAKAPGAPGNPMGRARLVYKMPYTIHGTDDLDSLGKAVSHGSIRLANEHVIPLAEMMLKAGNAWQGDKWFRKMVANRTEEYQVPLDQPVPLKIQQ